MSHHEESLTGQVKDQAASLAGGAKDKAAGVANEKVDARSTQLGEQVDKKAESFRLIGDTLRDQGVAPLAGIADQLASYTEKAAEYLQDADAASLWKDLGTLAQRQPVLVSTGALLLGFAAARTLRASGVAQEKSDVEDRVSAASAHAGPTSPPASTFAPTPTPSALPPEGFQDPLDRPVPGATPHARSDASLDVPPAIPLGGTGVVGR